MQQVLTVEPRSQTGSAAKKVRHAGMVPGVVYGQGQPATPMQFSEFDLLKILRAGGPSQLIEIQGLGGSSLHVLLREVQRHPTRRNILHADFYRVQMDVAVRTEVPVHFSGESEAIRNGAVLIHHLDKVHVECLPGLIPEAYTVDLGKLVTFDDVIRVSDLPQFEGVRLHHDAEEVVMSVAPPRVLEDEEGAPAAEVAEPEVIRKGKAEEEG
ncbi:MAG: 50S ribosomal protein L25 [Caldilineales bacterium]|nr:50S ribosomal protein L25 [Caldilineales bacterium]MCW5860702.1 50S ribosomal protein L25 [Caldilineales bacterium]